jgi:hypothetical protein
MRRMSVGTLLILAFSVMFATATRASEHLPLTTLVLRDRVITINSGPNGLSYTISNQDGTVLDAQLSDAQLQAKYPEVYDDVRPAMAGSKKTDDSMKIMLEETKDVPSNSLRK